MISTILHKKGFKFEKDDFFTCLTVALARMKRNPAKGGVKSCLAFAYPGVKRYLQQNGIKPLDSKKVDAVLVGHDPTITYKKLNTAVGAIIENGAKLYTLHRNRRRFYLSCLKGWDVKPSRILMVSDDPFADLIGAKKIGMKTCWVLTGSQKYRSVLKKIPEKYRPDYILESVVDIPW
jgi:ribonucleotide monophosphatase NagD (HAD superfamily)